MYVQERSSPPLARSRYHTLDLARTFSPRCYLSAVGSAFVVLVRHATAIDETLAIRDPMRTLTASGRAHARDLGDRLRAQGVIPTQVWTSPLVRAVQTAELVVAGLGATVIVDVLPSLEPDESARATAVVAAVNGLPASTCVVLVGHEPGLSAIGAVLTATEDFGALGKASAVGIHDGVELWRL